MPKRNSKNLSNAQLDLLSSMYEKAATNSIDPTSKPRVGCEATTNLTFLESSRASTTFCLFPPDNEDAVS